MDLPCPGYSSFGDGLISACGSSFVLMVPQCACVLMVHLFMVVLLLVVVPLLW